MLRIRYEINNYVLWQVVRQLTEDVNCNSTLTNEKTECGVFVVGPDKKDKCLNTANFDLMKILNHLPNTLTLLNLTLGTLAVITMSLDLVPTTLMLMGGCVVADVLDGAIARKLGVAGGLGIQLDSLADIVSFGVLPGVILYFMGSKYGGEIPGPALLAGCAAVSTASAGLRLARCNIDERTRKYFWGLSTPAGAMLVAGWLWAEYADRDYGFGFSEIPFLALMISLFLIVSYHIPLRLPNLKSPKSGFVTASFLIISALIGVFTIGPICIPLAILLYVLLGVLNLALKWY